MIAKIIYGLTPGVRDLWVFSANSLNDCADNILLAHAKYYNLTYEEFLSLRASANLEISNSISPLEV